MSGIDLGNPGVLKNYLRNQMREGKGEFYFREKVLIFKGLDGSEFVAPQEIQDNYEEAQKIKIQAKINSTQKDLPEELKDKELELKEKKEEVVNLEKALHPEKKENEELEVPNLGEEKPKRGRPSLKDNS